MSKKINWAKELPPSLIIDLDKRGWSLDIYGAVFRKCASPQVLIAEEFYTADQLHGIGWMTMERTPIWSNDSYKGMRIKFTSFIPILGQHP